VIDWEEAQFDWVTWDLAGALGSFCGVDDRFDGAAAARFVAAYRAAGGTAAPIHGPFLANAGRGSGDSCARSDRGA
jgi:hypothetical protein